MLRLHANGSPKNTLFVLIYNGKRVLVGKPTTYDDAISTIIDLFPDTSTKNITLMTKEPRVCDGQFTEIAKCSWEILMDQLTSVTVVAQDVNPLRVANVPTSDTLKIFVAAPSGRAIPMVISRPAQLRHLFMSVSETVGVPADAITFSWGGRKLEGDDTPDSVALTDNDTISASVQPQVARMGKPVIYLYSPASLEASVTLSLIPDWKLSVIYPVVDIKRSAGRGGEKISWKVLTKTDGSLSELNTGLDVSYLFWEAETDLTVPMSPPPSPIMDQANQCAEMFHPRSSTLSDNNSVLFPVNTITPYLDQALKALGLHTEARTSFITYWLPSILRHKYIALRFLPQSAYESAAPLNITPRPDIVTRIFMLFKGVPDGEISDWAMAEARATTGVDWWRDIVGVDVERACDATLFRVLEWGGMEVIL